MVIILMKRWSNITMSITNLYSFKIYPGREQRRFRNAIKSVQNETKSVKITNLNVRIRLRLGKKI